MEYKGWLGSKMGSVEEKGGGMLDLLAKKQASSRVLFTDALM